MLGRALREAGGLAPTAELINNKLAANQGKTRIEKGSLPQADSLDCIAPLPLRR
jgi:hypothetical protein